MNVVSLTDTELVVLNGKCSPEVQAKVDLAIKRLDTVSELTNVPEKFTNLIVRLVEEAERNGKLVWRGTSIARCDVCGDSGGYAKYKRSSRYHRKGGIDYRKPIYLFGIEFADANIHVMGTPRVGCCNKCAKELAQYTPVVLSEIRAEMPKELTGIAPRWRKYDNRHCTKCGWTGHEGEMLLLDAIFGGKYPGECPQCHARNNPFGPMLIEVADGFTIVPSSGE